MISRPIQFVRRGEKVSLFNVPPTRTLLQVLREDLNCTGTKEGCGEGDCGACTVVLAELTPPPAGAPVLSGRGRIKYSAINSCIRLAHSIDGLALWTVEDLTTDPLLEPKPSPADGGLGARSAETGMDTKVHEDFDTWDIEEPTSICRATTPPVRAVGLHPAQQAMVQCHGSQCGFCTPGFVMSLFGIYQNRICQGEPVSRELALEDLSGNLCRCTGYRPIVDAAQAMGQLPPVRVNESKLLQQLQLLKHTEQGLQPDFTYFLPQNLAQLLSARAQAPQAQIVAGCTDVGLWINKLHMDFAQVLDVTQVQEFKRVEKYPHHIAIGAAVSLADAFAALVQDRPHLRNFANRFAGLPVRNSGTLGGNVANSSPIGDSMPLLIALGTNIVLMGEKGHREMPLESFYTGYRQNVLANDEVLAWVKVPKATPGEFSRVYKISKRFDDDISAVCLAVNLHVEDGVVTRASIGAGGVAATPARARSTEAALAGQPWTQGTVERAMATLRAEFSPISDMRASSVYRTQVLGNLLQRFWLESHGLQQINLACFDVEGEAA